MSSVVAEIKRAVAFFSLEMSSDELGQRILSCETGVPFHAIRQGRLDGQFPAR